MAVTKIWPIKGRLRNVIDYTVNPEKTFNPNYTFEELQALKDVIDYAMESDKTEKIKNLRRMTIQSVIEFLHPSLKTKIKIYFKI